MNFAQILALIQQLLPLAQAVLGAVAKVQEQGATPQQAVQVVADHVTAGRPNSTLLNG